VFVASPQALNKLRRLIVFIYAHTSEVLDGKYNFQIAVHLRKKIHALFARRWVSSRPIKRGLKRDSDFAGGLCSRAVPKMRHDVMAVEKPKFGQNGSLVYFRRFDGPKLRRLVLCVKV
jgi:hypothetical protein